MEVATTNNHSQSHHHHHQHQLMPHNNNHSGSGSGGGGVGASTVGVGGGSGAHSPFQREVREWQRIDPQTGALLSGRLEADRWINGPSNSYGKKSSSSISSNSSNNSSSILATPPKTTTSTATMSNTHSRNASKISLHAIVGNETKSSIETAEAATATTSWPNRHHYKQPDIYGNNNNNKNNNSLRKSRVGVNNVDHRFSASDGVVGGCGDDDSGGGGGDGVGCGGGGGGGGGGGVSDRHLKQSVRLTPTQLNRQQRRDLESFRHYNEQTNASKSSSSSSILSARVDSAAAAAAAVDDDDDDDELRLSARHQRRQQVTSQTPHYPSTTQSLQRSRSISTDDLSTEWNTFGDDNDATTVAATSEEPSEWRRVSKLRRSFQSQNTKSHDYKNQSPTTTTIIQRRPLDLPTNSVSVSKIRAELENGRRLNTAMRNNHVDLAALDTILNAPAEVKPALAKRTTFLTAESLKEIRGKLKKLSDESLYKDDFLVHQQQSLLSPTLEIEHIEVQALQPKYKPFTHEQTDAEPVTPTSPRSAFQPVKSFVQQRSLSTGQQHKTHSLESRQKYKDTNSNEWHLRRKSYGFEKMSPPDDNKSMFRMDASTDSGLGRSGELGNWSPTETSAAGVRGTIIHFGENAKPARSSKSFRQLKTPEEDEPAENNQLKRHSFAGDDNQYLRRTQVHLNGLNQELTTQTEHSTLFQRSQQKRVEFCKTEVHFAAESGRVNIVETDGKPPPTNNFRRRRRTTSGPLQSLVKSATTVTTTNSTNSTSSSSCAMPITHFGDDHRRQILASSGVAFQAMLIDAPETLETTSVTVSIPKQIETTSYTLQESSRNSYTSTSGIESTDGENDEISAIRGILKNKPIKPKPYHLGENIESTDALWGVQLKSINAGTSTAISSRQSPESQSLQLNNKSVAERVRVVEKRQDQQSNGYSTKINLSLGDKDWSDNTTTAITADLPQSNVMSIALHSPQAVASKPEPLIRSSQVAPIAKPRTITNVIQQDQPQVHTATSFKQSSDNESENQALKIVKEARGARKLRQHELSYFGVPTTVNGHEQNTTRTKLLTHNNLTKRTLPTRKLNGDGKLRTNPETELNIEKQTTKWQLMNDRPDLLRHSPIEVVVKPTERKSLLQKRRALQESEEDIDEEEEDDEHFYENIANDIKPTFRVKSGLSPTNSYDRKTDVQRDAMILSEMTHNADQTMKALSDEAALKDQRHRRSLQRRNSKPLETIKEKTFNEKLTEVARGTFASEARRNSRHSTPSPTHEGRARSSSQSSIECCPRARSRSLSSEREYENVKQAKAIQRQTGLTNKARTAKHVSSRSSSHESITQCSSGDENTVKRVRAKRPTSSSLTREKYRKEEKQVDKHTTEGSTNSSTRRAAVESMSTVHEPRREHRQLEHRPQRTHSSQRTTSSTRRHEKDPEHRSSTRSQPPAAVSSRTHSSEKRDERSQHHSSGSLGSRLMRPTRGHQHSHDSSNRSSSRSERADKDKEKLSQSRELLVLGILIMGATQPHKLHKRFRSLQSFQSQ